MGDTIHKPREVTQAVTESQIRLCAQLELSKTSNEDIAKQLGITVYAVRKLQERDEYKNAIRDLADDMVRVAASKWRGEVGKLIPKALSVLEKNLDQGRLDAVKLVMATIGLDKQEQTASGGVLQVVLPDYNKKEPKDVEID